MSASRHLAGLICLSILVLTVTACGRSELSAPYAGLPAGESGRDLRYTIEGGGHAWPGGAAGRRRADSPGDLPASQLIWEFFAAHPMP